MPKKLNIHPNERIDIPDYVRGSNGFTEDSIHYVRKTLVSSSGSVYLLGFRVEIANQSTSPGEFTVHNGKALDRLGRQLHNEDEVTKTATSTLPGASTTYYIEIEYVETDTDVDSRAFWDPTFVNSGDQLPGKEFLLNVSTRVSSDWTLVSPVSTSGFEKDSNPSSGKLPLAILETNASGEITGVTTVPASDLLEVEAASGANEVRVLDSSIFPASGDAIIGFGGSNPETVTITANDYENNVISFTPSLVNTQPAGSIIRQTGSGIPSFLQERKSGVVDASDTDQQRRMWQGDENRGSVVLTSKETFGDRSDLNIRDLKDYVDSLASQLRELKFGTDTVGSLSGELPPLSSSEWSEGRWYTKSGGLWGARSHTVTIGDGTNSLGDLNTTSGVTDLGALLQEAIDAASSDGISIFVKQGDYVLETTPSLDKPINLVFDDHADVGSDRQEVFSVDTNSDITIRNFKFDSSLGSVSEGNVFISSTATNTNLQIYDSKFNSVQTTAGGGVLVLENCVLEAKGLRCIDLPGTYVALKPGSRISKCTFSSSAGNPGVAFGKLHNLLFEKNTCLMGSANEVFVCEDLSSSFASYPNVIIKDCTFDSVSASAAPPFLFDNDDFVSGPVIENCIFTNITLSAGTTQRDRSIFYLASTNSFVFRNNDVRGCSVSSTTEGSPGYIFNSPLDVPRGVISGCQFQGGGLYTISVRVRDGSHEITNNYFTNTYTAIQTDSQSNVVGDSYIVGNRIVYDASGTAATDVIGIDSGHLVRSYIAENYIRLVQDTVNSPLEFIGIKISQAPWPSGLTNDFTSVESDFTLLQIKDNTIDGIGGKDSGSDGLAYGINFNDSASNLYVDIQENKIHGVTREGSLYGTHILCSALRGTFFGNTVSIISEEDANKLVAAQFETSSVASEFLVSSNKIDVIHRGTTSGPAPQSFNTIAAIGGGEGFSITNNYLRWGSFNTEPDPSIVSLKFTCGIRLEVSNANIVGNKFLANINDSGAGIVLFSGDYNHIQIANNQFLGTNGGKMEYCIVADASEGMTSLRNFSVMNNSFEISKPMTYVVFVEATGISTNDGIYITGNSVYEPSSDPDIRAFVVLSAIYVNISNNTIRGTNTSSTLDKAPAIYIENSGQITINSNSILGWCGSIVSGSTSGKGVAIRINGSTNGSIVGNHIQPGVTDTAVPEIDLSSSNSLQSGFIDANLIYSNDANGSINDTGALDVTLGTNRLI